MSYISVHNISTLIKEGTFDEVLTKPLNPFLYLSSRHFSTGYFGTMSISLLIMFFCFARIGIALSPIKIFFLLFVVISGGLITSSMMILASIPTFWIIENRFIKNFIFGINDFANYPITIFNKKIQIMVTLLVPFAFINFYPAQYFLGKNDFSIFHPIFQFLSPVVGIIMFFLAYKLWMFRISRYKSTGS
ncbi:MAG: hypothetical protein FIA99_01535 [Ruminiclostridium sp.]|nr:hypothetical protein [Ruminiclostridium sp.]